jgi:hypothetical protein
MVPFPRRLPHTISPLEGGGFELPVPRGRPALNNTPKPNECRYFAGVIATQEFALGLSQLGTDGSNPLPSSGESGANLIFGGEYHPWSGISPTPTQQVRLR